MFGDFARNFFKNFVKNFVIFFAANFNFYICTIKKDTLDPFLICTAAKMGLHTWRNTFIIKL